MTAYKPGDKIECRLPNGPWVPLGSYLATTSSGTIVCEKHGRSTPSWADSTAETRLVPDTVTVTVEIERAGAEAVVTHGGNPAAEDPPARTEAFQAFIVACAKAVES